jgi:hypothetical protein
MLPRADDNTQVNIFRKRMHKKREEQEEKEDEGTEEKTQQKIKEAGSTKNICQKKHKFTPSSTRGLMAFEEK